MSDRKLWGTSHSQSSIRIKSFFATIAASTTRSNQLSVVSGQRLVAGFSDAFQRMFAIDLLITMARRTSLLSADCFPTL
jgi:hypothetical protein